MRHIADSVDALYLVDMAHIAGLVAAGVHPSPLPYADIVTCTTTKTMRGPRGGLILSRDSAWARQLQSAIFPGVQGSLHSQIIAAKAVCLGEALSNTFQDYAKQVIENARVLSQTLSGHGIKLVSGGTDTHMVLLDFSTHNISGQEVQDRLAQVNLTSNKNPVPFDSTRPSEWAGLRLGVAAATTRGLQRKDFKALGDIIARTIEQGSESQIRDDRDIVLTLCERFPIYS